jgi:hypothetical protein
MSGGNDDFLKGALMIAAGVAAPMLAPALMSGGAAAGLVGGGLGATGATALTGAGLSGLAAGVTGGDVGKSMLLGGLGGAASGALGGVEAAAPGSQLAAGTTAPGAGLSTNPNLAANVISSPQNMIGAGGVSDAVAKQNLAAYGLGNDPAAAALFNNTSNTPALASFPQQAASTPPSLFGMPKAGVIGGGAGLVTAMGTTPVRGAYVPPEYKGGPLSRFKYDPDTYQPDVVQPPRPPYRPVYAAEGGLMSLAMGGPAPQTNFANPAQSMMGTSQYAMATDPMTGNIAQRNMAKGGPVNNSLADLMKSRGKIAKYRTDYQSDPSSVSGKARDGDYSAMLAMNEINRTPNQNYADGGIAQLAVGGKLLRGAGDGMSDNIRANINGKQEARLADGEFVVPADVVSHLGNGSTDAGAKHLYSMMDKVRKARTGTKKQGKKINSSKYMPA